MSNKAASNGLSIYIPRILGNVKRKDIVETFNRLDIGNVTYVDMHKKINDKRHTYYFAFITVELYNSTAAKQLVAVLNKENITKMVYDEESNNYWELKKFIRRDQRTPSPPLVIENNDTFVNTGKLYGLAEFDLVKEYESLQREIYAFVTQDY